MAGSLALADVAVKTVSKQNRIQALLSTWKTRPVLETFYDKVWAQTETRSVLIGGIFQEQIEIPRRTSVDDRLQLTGLPVMSLWTLLASRQIRMRKVDCSESSSTNLPIAPSSNTRGWVAWYGMTCPTCTEFCLQLVD